MREEAFEVPVEGGVLRGHRGGEGAPAVLLHGGPAVPDYTGACADELDGLFSTVRYTQRGTAPSTAGPPYSIESHVSDTLAILDAVGIERAWAIGHSWGGHLALHLLVAHPERLLGFIGVDALGAYDTFGEQDANLRRGLSAAEIARIEEVEARRRRGEATEADLLERLTTVWPQFFADPANAPSAPPRIGVHCSRDTNASILAHLERGTLVKGLPGVRLPSLFVHGELDPLPLRAATETAALIPGAAVETVPNCGHFPWLERPGELRSAVAGWLA